MTEQACDFKEGDLVIVRPEYADEMYEAYNQPHLYGIAKRAVGQSIALGKPALVLHIWDDEMWITDPSVITKEFIAPLTKWFKLYKAIEPIDRLL